MANHQSIPPISQGERAALAALRPPPQRRLGTAGRVGLNIEDLEYGPVVTKFAMKQLHKTLTKKTSYKDNRKRTRIQENKTDNKKRVRGGGQDTMTMQTFPFFALPVELRLAVYFELLVSDDRLLMTWQGPRKAQRQQKKMYIDVLLASRQCRDEGLTVLYGENIFDIGELCELPFSTATHFLLHIGTLNASLIRIIIAEYSAASEEFWQLNHWRNPLPPRTGLARAMLSRGIGCQTALPYVILYSPVTRILLHDFGIDIAQLRLLAFSLKPFGDDQATLDLMWREQPLLMRFKKEREIWLKTRNEKARLGRIADVICERDTALVRADFSHDVDAKVMFHWSSLWMGREWLVYKGMPQLREGRTVTLCLRGKDAPAEG